MLTSSFKKLSILCIIAFCFFNAAYADEPQIKSDQKNSEVEEGIDSPANHLKANRSKRRSLRKKNRQAKQSKKKFLGLMNRLRQQMIPPRLILKQHAKLNLSEGQVKQIREIMKAAKSRLELYQTQQNTLVQEFEKKLNDWETNENDSSEEELLTAMQAYLSNEKTRRNERLMVSLKVRKILNNEQRQKLIELKKEFWSPEGKGMGKNLGRGKARRAERRQKRLDRLERRMERIENRRSNQR